MNIKRRGIYEKIINIILDILIVIFGIFLLISIYNNVQIKILGNEYSSFFGYSTFEVQTGSMADTINPGDWIVVKNEKDIKLDDIVTYSQDGDFITHRVVETYNDTFVTKGDANNSKDDPISRTQIVGKVIKILPGFGIIRKTFFNPLVLITLIITLYSVSYVLRSVKQKDENTDKKYNYKEKIDYLINLVLTKIIDFVKEHVKNDENSNLNGDKETIDESNYENDGYVDLEDSMEFEDFNIDIPEINVEDMDKTLFFRKISVDKSELDGIEKKKEKELEQASEIISKTEEVEVDEIEEKVLLIQNKKKKFKHIVDKAIYFKKEEINEIIDIICFDDKMHTNEPTIKDELLNAYIDGRYYNHCGNINVDFNKKTVLSRIDNELKVVGEILVNNYKGSDNKFAEKVDKYVNIFLLINSLEQINIKTLGIKEKRDAYRNKLLKILKIDNLSAIELKNMINQILRTQKIYQSMVNYILEQANSNVFNLVLNNITGYKNLCAVSLEHNILFSKVYSDYIVDKTYTEGIIAEDKVLILLNLLLTKVVRDMFDLEEDKKYFIHIPNSIYEKPNKMDKIFKMFDDEYAKSNIIVVVEYENLVQFGKQISSLRKKGYRFAVVLNCEINDGNQGYLELVDYLFVDKKLVSYNLISSVPEDLLGTMINDDIMSKLSSFGGE